MRVSTHYTCSDCGSSATPSNMYAFYPDGKLVYMCNNCTFIIMSRLVQTTHNMKCEHHTNDVSYPVRKVAQAMVALWNNSPRVINY